MATEDTIPVVDFKDIPLESTTEDVSSHEDLVRQLHTAFRTVGFVFITNHGIERELIDRIFSCAMDFFSMPVETKKLFLQRVGKEDTENTGYVAVEQESVNPTQPGDLKECFQVAAVENLNLFPNEHLPPKFKPLLFHLYSSALSLGKTILHFMGHALQLEDPMFFVKNHQKTGVRGNYTTARLLYYPPIPPSIKPGQLRCGEHVDYGSITLLFQDPTGGLQVKRSDGGYIDVPYRSDAVLVNLGALMQKWTADTYLATPHRVLIPEEEEKRKKTRQSIAVFLHPDHDTVIRCLDGSSKYPEITAYEDTHQRLDNSYDKSFQ